MQLPSEKDLNFYDQHKVARPSHDEHGIQDTFEHPLKEQLVPGNARNWRMEGNELLCDTDFGPMRQRIPTDYICLGTDGAGLPILKKIGV